MLYKQNEFNSYDIKKMQSKYNNNIFNSFIRKKCQFLCIKKQMFIVYFRF